MVGWLFGWLASWFVVCLVMMTVLGMLAEAVWHRPGHAVGAFEVWDFVSLKLAPYSKETEGFNFLKCTVLVATVFPFLTSENVFSSLLEIRAPKKIEFEPQNLRKGTFFCNNRVRARIKIDHQKWIQNLSFLHYFIKEEPKKGVRKESQKWYHFFYENSILGDQM